MLNNSNYLNAFQALPHKALQTKSYESTQDLIVAGKCLLVFMWADQGTRELGAEVLESLAEHGTFIYLGEVRIWARPGV